MGYNPLKKAQYFLGARGYEQQNTAFDKLTPEQSAALARMIPQLQQRAENPDYAGAENFFQSTIQNPAIENMNRYGIPAVQARGSLHSSANANAERNVVRDTMSGLSQQRGQIMESERQGTKDYMKMLLGALGVESKDYTSNQPGLAQGFFGTVGNIWKK